MSDHIKTMNTMLEHLRDIYENKIPFNTTLGLRITTLKPDLVTVTFEMADSLVGNYVHGSLHGGVISAALDAVGGITATAGMIHKMMGQPVDKIVKDIAKVGTIDLRVDYLIPGQGRSFSASASIMRIGNKVAVARMELHNDRNLLIAVGTGTYIIG